MRKTTSMNGEGITTVKFINQYKVGATLGEGSFGKVKLVEDTISGEQLAMKILRRTGKVKIHGNASE